MTTALTEGKHDGEYIVDEGDYLPSMTREQVTLDMGQDLEAGTVLGQLTAGGNYVQHDPAASDGSEDAVAILFGNTDATEADTRATITKRLTVVNGAQLVWPDGISDNDKADAVAKLAEQFIIVV